jgi:hypothetical protein
MEEMKKDERVRRKEKKRAEKEELLSKVPKVDENGMSLKSYSLVMSC